MCTITKKPTGIDFCSCCGKYSISGIVRQSKDDDIEVICVTCLTAEKMLYQSNGHGANPNRYHVVCPEFMVDKNDVGDTHEN